MAGSPIPIPIDNSVSSEAMAMNPILDQWQVQYARFVHFPPLSSFSSAAIHLQPSLIPRSNASRKVRKGGVWISTSSSSSAAAASAGPASLKLIAVSSDEAILNLSVGCKILEEHRVSQLHFTWPQVSCLSGFPARGSRAIFVSYKDCFGQVHKFTVRFLTIYKAEEFIGILKEVLHSAPVNLQGSKFSSELSSHSEFVPQIGLPYRDEEDRRHATFGDTGTTLMETEEDWRHTISAETSTSYRTDKDSRNIPIAETITDQEPATLNFEVDKHSNGKETMLNSEIEEFLGDFPPSFASFLKNCYPESEKVQANLPEQIDLKAEVARYMEDSTFQDILLKVEKVINEMGDGVML